MNILKVTVFFLTSLLCVSVFAEKLHIAVASNFTAPMKEIAIRFEQKFGHKLTVSYGSSGKIYAQLKHGAPFDVFLSADQEKPKALIEQGMVVDNSRITYAYGGLAVASVYPELITNVKETLQSGAFKKLALANPKLAPYGAAAVEVLQKLEINGLARRHWVQGENIAQTYQFVATGNADLGFIAMSQVKSKSSKKRMANWVVPTSLYSPIKQDAVLMKKAKNKVAAREFLAFLKNDDIEEIIMSYGYHAFPKNG